MQANEKPLTVPERKLNVTGGDRKEKEESRGGDTDSSVVEKGRSSRAEILAKAREAKKQKKFAVLINENPVATTDATSKPDVVDNTNNNADDADDTDSDNDTDGINVRLYPPKSRKRLYEAILGGVKSESQSEEPPNKKHKTSAKRHSVGVVGNFILDKTLDIARLAAASGVASIGFVILKTLAGGQITAVEKNDGGITSEWIKQ